MKKIFLTLLIQLPSLLSAQTVDWQRVAIQEEDAMQKVYARSSVSASWLEGSTFLIYEQYGRFHIVDARTGRQEPLIKNQQRFVEQYQKLTGDSTMPADKLRLYGLTLKNNDCRRFYWTRAKKRMVYDRVASTASCAPCIRT